MKDQNHIIDILRKSKAIMNVVNEGNFERGNIDSNLITSGEGDDFSEGKKVTVKPSNTNVRKNNTVSSGNQYRNLNTTKMPKEIVEAMINNPIVIPETPFHSFELNEDILNEVNGDTKPKIQENTPKIRPSEKSTSKRIIETNSYSDDSIREMIAEEIERILPKIVKEYFDERLVKEEIQIKVGKTIFSGNLSPLPKKK